jgi:hypothetical protein
MQIRSHVTAIAVVISMALATSATAVRTATAPLRSSQNSILGCSVLNLSDQPVQVTAELDSGGLPGVLESGSLEIPAGQSRQIVFSSTAIFGGYCVFDFEGDASEVRGFITLQDLGGSNTRQLFGAEPLALRRSTQHTTYTLPVRSDEGDNLLCWAQNLSSEPVQVSAELDNGQGTVVDDGMLTIEPRFAQVVASSNATIFGGFCRFTFTANSTEVRGYIQLQDAGGSNTRLMQAAARIAAAEPEASPTPTETPGSGNGCCGDCNGNGVVQINELVTAVGFALNSCPAP